MIPFEHIKDWPIGDFVDSDTYVLMQYTGLKDKNSVEIYEGDTMKFTDYDGAALGKVEFISYGFMGVIPDKPHDRIWELNSADSEYEVIGNIYQNKEME